MYKNACTHIETFTLSFRCSNSGRLDGFVIPVITMNAQKQLHSDDLISDPSHRNQD